MFVQKNIHAHIIVKFIMITSVFVVLFQCSTSYLNPNFWAKYYRKYFVGPKSVIQYPVTKNESMVLSRPHKSLECFTVCPIFSYGISWWQFVLMANTFNPSHCILIYSILVTPWEQKISKLNLLAVADWWALSECSFLYSHLFHCCCIIHNYDYLIFVFDVWW